MKLFCLYVASIALLAPGTRATEEALANHLTTHGYQRVRFRIDDKGYLILPVRANAFVMRFLLDTGAGVSAISAQAARDLKLPVTATRGETIGAAGTMPTRSTIVDAMQIGPLCVRARRMAVVGLNEPLPTGVAYDAKAVEGLIGADLLRTSQSIIDYRSQTLFFRTPGVIDAVTCASDTVLRAQGYGVIDLATNAHGHLLLPVAVNTNTLDLVLDTGVPHTVLDSSVRRNLRLATEPTRTQGTGVGGSLGLISRTRLEHVALGPAALKGYPVFVADLNGGGRETTESRPHIEGVLGNDILALFSAVISYPEARLYLKAPPGRDRRIGQ